MGLFDNIRSDIPMPDGFSKKSFQTKSFYNSLELYIIGTDRKLYKNGEEYRHNGLVHFLGSELIEDPNGNVIKNGRVKCYNVPEIEMVGKTRYFNVTHYYIASFTSGNLDYIKAVSEAVYHGREWMPTELNIKNFCEEWNNGNSSYKLELAKSFSKMNISWQEFRLEARNYEWWEDDMEIITQFLPKQDIKNDCAYCDGLCNNLCVENADMTLDEFIDNKAETEKVGVADLKNIEAEFLRFKKTAPVANTKISLNMLQAGLSVFSASNIYNNQSNSDIVKMIELLYSRMRQAEIEEME